MNKKEKNKIKERDREKRELSTSKYNYFECNRPDNFLSASYLLIRNISIPPFPIPYTCKKSNISQMSLKKMKIVYQIQSF